ncbi:MAG: hypothetical protein ACQGVK_18595 [Myxococcota bacterium]
MRISRRWTHGIALLGVALCLPLFGCRWAESVTVQIPDFDSSAVEGVWIWREGDEDYSRSLHYRIEDAFTQDGEEYLLYTVLEPTGESRWTLPARIERDSFDPDNVQIRFLLLLIEGGGNFRASTYNAVGESALSAETLEISSV